MLVPPEVLDCVGFLYCNTAGGLRPGGTVFFLSEDMGHGQIFMHAVTARHCLNQMAAVSVDGAAYIRCNKTGGGFGFIQTPLDAWTFHPDDTKPDDVAVLIGGGPMPPEWDVKFCPRTMLATDDVIEQQSIGVGDDLFLTGLFVNHVGQERNVPILRVGNIAAMPSEPIKTEVGLLDAYLVEARSIGGLSGSPVFVNLEYDRSLRDEPRFLMTRTERTTTFRLLGVMHGHWNITRADPDAAPLDARDEVVNMGIGIVLPASKIVDILDRPEVVELRERVRRHVEATMMPTADTPLADDDEPVSLAPLDFEQALGALLETPPPEKG